MARIMYYPKKMLNCLNLTELPNYPRTNVTNKIEYRLRKNNEKQNTPEKIIKKQPKKQKKYQTVDKTEDILLCTFTLKNEQSPANTYQ